MSIMNSLHQATILVVDDDPDTLELLIEFLRIAGYHALPARGGDVALSILKNAGFDFIGCDDVRNGWIRNLSPLETE